ncbi:MAG: Txe/YoeB family addiction module toxin [Selenomonadaceae bacterium]|nr:Txe/YoeB family addiction module toxin [Selenomonadaceae bacterium]
MNKLFSERAFAEYLYWQAQDRKTLNKINRLLQSIERDGVLNGEGKPEKLKYRDGEYSRRIDDANRLVYKIDGNNINVMSCRGHYE